MAPAATDATDADDAGALLRQSLLDFHGRMSQSIARLSEAPAAAADELDGLLCDWPRFKGETTEGPFGNNLNI